MAITDRTRKVLWGRSGNRCAICKNTLVVDATTNDDESVVGEECHIVSAAESGPRHDSAYPENQFDDYVNLILLCRTHHKMVDDQVDTYNSDILLRMKKNHEEWVTKKLDEPENKRVRITRRRENVPKHLHPIFTGKELFDLVAQASGYLFDYEELETEDEVGLVSDFLQNLQDWGEVSDDLESGNRVKAAYTIQQELEILRVAGFCIFGASETRYLEGGISSEPTPLGTAIVKVVRQDSPDIYVPEHQPNAEQGSAHQSTTAL